MAEIKKSALPIKIIAICAVLGILILTVFVKFKQKLNQADALTYALQRAAQAHNNNLKDVTAELKRARDDLKAVQDKFSNLGESQVSLLRKKIDELSKVNQAYLSLKNSHSELEKTISELNAEKKEIIQKMDSFQAKAKEADFAGKPQDKPEKKSNIAAQLARLKSQKNELEDKMLEQNKIIARLNFENSRLQQVMSKTSEQLSEKNSDFDGRLQESGELKNEIALLQETASKLEKELFNARMEQAEKNSAIDVLNIQKDNLEKENKRKIMIQESSERVKKLQEQKVAAQLRLSQAQVELSRKNETIASLEGNIQLLKNGLTQKEQQKKSLETAILEKNILKDSSQKQLFEQQIRIDELNSINDILKAKLTEFSSSLANKEFQLQKSSNKITLLEKEMYDLQLRLKDSRCFPADQGGMKRQVEGILKL
jgi:chromosome segregation ATPase